MESFNASLTFDRKMFEEDIQGSQVHAKMLNKIGVLSDSEFKQIDKGLIEILEEMKKGNFVWDLKDEDIHMAVESRLTEKIGSLGGKLHTARSRNDQVALDLRLYCRKKLGELNQTVVGLQKVLIALAETNGFIPLPGYTHLQRAQAVLFGHHLMAYFEMLQRDRLRIADALKRTNICPLGSGALAGSTFPVDRELIARELGFADVTHNSLDAVSDRDFVAEIIFVVSLIMVHLSRFSEELILWSSQEFGFVTLPQEFCTGSSMMPQKMNPDAPELIRGKTGRVFGDLMAILTTLKGLPLAYNKDLQEDKEALFDALETVEGCLAVLIRMLPQIEIHPERMKKATEDGFLLATDLADYLASKGMEFRSAHEVVGKIVNDCIDQKTVLEKISLKELKKFSPVFDEDVSAWLDVGASIDRRKSVGGTATERVREEIKRAKKIIAS